MNGINNAFGWCLSQWLLLARLMGQYCFACCRLSASVGVVVCNARGRSPGRARGRSGDRHCTAEQYGYVPLGRHLVMNSAADEEDDDDDDCLYCRLCVCLYWLRMQTQKIDWLNHLACRLMPAAMHRDDWQMSRWWWLSLSWWVVCCTEAVDWLIHFLDVLNLNVNDLHAYCLLLNIALSVDAVDKDR